MPEPSLPSAGSYIQSIRDSAKSLTQSSQISINRQNIERLLHSELFQSTYPRLTALPGIALPLNFASPLDELNVLSLLALLSFGSAHDAPLRAQTGFGASNAIRALVFSMYITSTPSEGDFLSAKGMEGMPAAKVAELMGVQVHVEKPHSSIPGVVVGELEGPVFEFVKSVTDVLNQTGQVLGQGGYPNLGFLVVEALKEGEKSKTGSEAVIERLVRAIPAFRDMETVDGKPVYIFSKVLFLLAAISARFGSATPPPFPIPDVGNLPLPADSITTSVLVYLGIVDISASPALKGLVSPPADEALQSLLAAGKGQAPEQTGDAVSVDSKQAFRLRAAAVTACEAFPEIAKDLSLDVTVPRMNVWLQNVVKERPDYKALPGFTEKDSVYF